MAKICLIMYQIMQLKKLEAAYSLKTIDMSQLQ